jgi:hypothetical protein
MHRLAQLRYQMNQDSNAQLPFALPELFYNIDRLVFQVGWIKGIAYLGAIGKLFKRFVDRSKLKAMCGSSAVAIMVFLIALGFTQDEMPGNLQNLQLTYIMDSDYRDKLLILMGIKAQLKLAIQGIAADLARVGKLKDAPSGAVSSVSNLIKTADTPDMKLLTKDSAVLNKDQFGLFPGNYLRKQVFERLIQPQTDIACSTFADPHQFCLHNPEKYSDLYLNDANVSIDQVGGVFI